MTKPVVLITGASGFLGSAVCVDLARNFTVIAIDLREPSDLLRKAAPQVSWHILDISDIQSVSEVFAQVKSDFGQIDFVIHLAAYYDFGKDWVGEYQSTNITGTANILNASRYEAVKRLIFASSIAAMEPPTDDSSLNEKSPTSEYIPYARSKSLGEKLIIETSGHVPFTILRIAGVFSDWCELPPLYGLIKLWTSVFPFGCIVPGRGESGIPYIHLNDFVSLIRQCVSLDRKIGPSNIFLASPQGAVLHRQLFPVIRSESRYPSSIKPIHITQKIAKTGLQFRHALGRVTGHTPYEQPWMLDYVDKSWATDTALTRGILNWDCTPDQGILQKIPIIMSNLRKDPTGWESRNKSRNQRSFVYSGI
jgi:nucleoside-diphosphate-sugar epimerase